MLAARHSADFQILLQKFFCIWSSQNVFQRVWYQNKFVEEIAPRRHLNFVVRAVSSFSCIIIAFGIHMSSAKRWLVFAEWTPFQIWMWCGFLLVYFWSKIKVKSQGHESGKCYTFPTPSRTLEVSQLKRPGQRAPQSRRMRKIITENAGAYRLATAIT